MILDCFIKDPTQPLCVAPIDIEKGDIIEFSIDWCFEQPQRMVLSIVRDGKQVYPLNEKL
jgi:hypothetical protein